MKEYKFITLHSNGNTFSKFSHGEELLNEYTTKGWEVDKMISTNKDEILVLLSRNTGTTMILD